MAIITLEKEKYSVENITCAQPLTQFLSNISQCVQIIVFNLISFIKAEKSVVKIEIMVNLKFIFWTFLAIIGSNPVISFYGGS